MLASLVGKSGLVRGQSESLLQCLDGTTDPVHLEINCPDNCVLRGCQVDGVEHVPLCFTAVFRYGSGEMLPLV